MRIELRVAVEMADWQVQAWADGASIHPEAMEYDVTDHLRESLKEDLASSYWKTEVR